MVKHLPRRSCRAGSGAAVCPCTPPRPRCCPGGGRGPPGPVCPVCGRACGPRRRRRHLQHPEPLHPHLPRRPAPARQRLLVPHRLRRARLPHPQHPPASTPSATALPHPLRHRCRTFPPARDRPVLPRCEVARPGWEGQPTMKIIGDGLYIHDALAHGPLAEAALRRAGQAGSGWTGFRRKPGTSRTPSSATGCTAHCRTSRRTRRPPAGPPIPSPRSAGASASSNGPCRTGSATADRCRWPARADRATVRDPHGRLTVGRVVTSAGQLPTRARSRPRARTRRADARRASQPSRSMRPTCTSVATCWQGPAPEPHAPTVKRSPMWFAFSISSTRATA